MAVKLTCPECSATLKLSQAAPAGRKIKCPRCGSSFLPPDEEEAPKPAKPVKQAADDDDESGSAYSFSEEPQSKDDKAEKNKPSIFDQPMRDRFPKSKRGPAQAAVILPSNGLMAAGILTCMFYMVLMAIVVWPVIFGDSPMDGRRWFKLAVYILCFVVGGLITGGATKMQNLESYGWAIGASALAILPVTLITWPAAQWPATSWPLTLPMGLWCVLTLQKPHVRAGFRVMKRPRREPAE